MLKDHLRALCEIDGISSAEEAVAQFLQAHLPESSLDGLGSVLTELPHRDGASRLLFATHMDEIGFLVRDITDEGFLHLRPIGSWWVHLVLGQPMVVTTRKGLRFSGLVSSPATHGQSAEARKRVRSEDELYLDLGLDDRAAVKRLGIDIGDAVAPEGYFREMANPKYWQAKALDNRAGCAVGLEVVQRLWNEPLPLAIQWAFTAQEEPGLRGARSATHLLRPDLAFAIDTTLAGDTPFNKNSVRLGGGVCFSMIDSNTLIHRGLLREVEALCRKEGIPFQRAVFHQGGTDAGNIHKSLAGVATMGLAVPVRYMHTNHTLVHEDDLCACVQLALAICRKFDESAVRAVYGA